MLREVLEEIGLIAILRGIRPVESAEVAHVLYHVGFRIIEVPLNSHDAITSIRRIREELPCDCLVGAGTVLEVVQVHAVKDAGGALIVMPHGDRGVIDACIDLELDVLPGVATATEAIAAHSAGADILKVFPADHLGPSVIRAWRAVLPIRVGLVPVGGIDLANLAEFHRAGANGFGIGSSLYKPGISLIALEQKATEFVRCWKASQRPQSGQDGLEHGDSTK